MDNVPIENPHESAMNELLDRIRELEAENKRLTNERDLYRRALQRMTESPQMGQPGELPRYIAKDALRDGVRIRNRQMEDK